MDITQMTVESLKALAYDTLVIIENNQKNLQMINQEIQKKLQPTPEQADVIAEETKE